MAVRNDIIVDFLKSPRIIRIPNTSDEVTQQDLYDTLRSLEDDPGNMSYNHLIDSAGKEELGGGVLVGITNELQNAILFFVPDLAVIESGTVTTGDATGVTLTDTAATFITNGVTSGAMVVNFTDQSIASVISIDSETQLTCEPLDGGSDNGFDSGDTYKVWNVIQKDVTGGNLVALNEAGDAQISPILPSAVTQIKTTASSSATLQEQIDIQFGAFSGVVTVDSTSSYSGTEFPVGTLRQPVNNIVDAVTIAQARGFRTLKILGDITLDTGDNVSNYTLEGIDFDHSIITVNTGAVTTNTLYRECTLLGTLDGGSSAVMCHIGILNFVDGTFHNCMFMNTITLSGSSQFAAIDCYSGIPGASTPVLDMGGSGTAVLLRNYHGGLEIQNRTGTDDVSIDLSSGQIILDSTVTNGTIIVRGIGKLIDNSVGATVVDELVSLNNIGNVVWDELAADHTTADTFGRRITQMIAKINAAIGLS
jgi:hypothetical protein